MKTKPISVEKLAAYKERFLFDHKPITVELALTDVCPFHCSYCRYRRTEDYIGEEEFSRILVRMLQWKVRGAMLCGGGEPQSSPAFESIAGQLDAVGLPYGVNTNFSSYKAMNPAWVRVSIHRETDKQCWDNIKRFRREHPRASLGIQAIIERPGQAREFLRQYGGFDCTYVSLRPVEKVKDAYTVSDLESIKAEIAELQGRYPRVLRNYKWDFVGHRFGRCAACWTSLFIDARCNVAYCCNKPEDIIGSVFDKDILEKHEAYAFRPETCESPCRHTGNNVVVEGWEGSSDPEVESFI